MGGGGVTSFNSKHFHNKLYYQHGTVNYTPPLPNMKLADYRYGREEMLALFDKDVQPSMELLALGALFVEKCQYPLNLIQVSLKIYQPLSSCNLPTLFSSGFLEFSPYFLLLFCP